MKALLPSAPAPRFLVAIGRSVVAFARNHPHQRNLLTFTLTTIVSFVILNNLPVPFAWIAFLWFGLLLAMTLVGARPLPRYIWFNIGFAWFALGVVELLLAASAPADHVRIRTVGELTTDHPVLGYAPVKNATARWQFLFDDQVVHDVTYRIDRQGLRRSPNWRSDDHKAVACFGGSFTFGHGVQDEETWPYRIGVRTGGSFRVYNFGFGGYGAHQMLAALEQGVVDTVLEEAPQYAVYLAISDHIRRVAGEREWDEHGPKYTLGDDGRVTLDGRFSDHRWFPKKWQSKLRRSYFADRVLGTVDVSVDSQDVALYVAVVAAARTVFEQRYAGSQFHILLWDSGTWPYKQEVLRRLEDRHLRVHLISAIIPDVESNPARYILKHDGHPNRLAYDRIAAYAVQTIVR